MIKVFDILNTYCWRLRSPVCLGKVVVGEVLHKALSVRIKRALILRIYLLASLVIHAGVIPHRILEE